MRIYVTKLSYSAFSIFSNLVYPIHNGNCHKQQMINKYYIYPGSYELTYLNQRIRRMSWFK